MSDELIKFAKSDAYTLGVEMEFQLIDPVTLDLYPIAPSIIDKWSGRDDRLKPELLQSMIEVNTGVCRDVHEVRKDLYSTVSQLSEICRELGVELAANGTHSTARHWERKLYPGARYQELVDRNQFIARRLMIFGLHVHVGARDSAHCMRMHNEFIRYLPHLLALSASSPFWEGHDTGLASSRITVFEALPTGGHPCLVSTWEEYQLLIQKLIRSKAIRDLKDIWWDIRPSPLFGTLEIRVCDSTATIMETLALTALIHCLALSFEEKEKENHLPVLLPDWLVRENKWRSSRHGLDADLIYDSEGNTRSIREDILMTLECLEPIALRFGYESYFKFIRDQMMNNPSYSRQRQVYESTSDLKEVTRSLIFELKEDIEKAADLSPTLG